MERVAGEDDPRLERDLPTDRPYRGRLSREDAWRRLREAAASHFDLRGVDTFLRLVDSGPGRR